MNTKVLAIGIVAVMVVAGVGAAIFIVNNNDKDDEKSILTHRLLVMGNVFSDDTLDSKDVTVLEAVVKGEDKKITVADNEIDLTDASLKKYADVNQDGSVDSKDIDALKNIIDGKVEKLYYENVNGNIVSVKVPINNIIVVFRRIGTTVAMVGASDLVKGFSKDLASTGNYGFLGFTGEEVGAANSIDSEKVVSLNNTYASTGGVTVIATATGSDSTLETKLDGFGIDVVRMPVTEIGKSENGVVTLGYLLAYKSDKHDQIINKLDTWINWNDGAKKKIADALANVKESDKKTCIVGMYDKSGTQNVNVRGSNASEYVYTVDCGGKNISGTTADQGYSKSELNEYLIANQPDYTFIMQQENLLLKNKESAQVIYDEFKDAISSNYHGKIGVFSQFFGTGPGYVLSLMYYASVLIPELKDAFDITAEYKYFMGTLVGNAELAEITAFVPIEA